LRHFKVLLPEEVEEMLKEGNQKIERREEKK
jgi:hypothetical protein